MVDLWGYCLCCVPGRRSRGQLTGHAEGHGGSASESTPLLGSGQPSNGRGSDSQRQSLATGGFADGKGGPRGSVPFPQGGHTSHAGGLGSDAAGSSSAAPAGGGGGTGTPTSLSAQPLAYTASDLAVITGWAKARFIDVGVSIHAQRAMLSPPPPQATRKSRSKSKRRTDADTGQKSDPVGEDSSSTAAPAAMEQVVSMPAAISAPTGEGHEHLDDPSGRSKPGQADLEAQNLVESLAKAVTMDDTDRGREGSSSQDEITSKAAS